MRICSKLRRGSALSLMLAAVVLTACTHVAPEVRTGNPPRENPNVLWHFLHDSCAPAAVQNQYPPRPCAEVSAPLAHFDRGYAVLKGRRGRYQYLVLPLAHITGIESPALLQADAPSYLGDAWTARLYVEAALHKIVPRYELSLAVNSEYGRTQNQLHIHVDCIRSNVHNTLRHLLPGMTSQWETLPVLLHGHLYMAKWVRGDSLSINPFRSLAAALPVGDHMAQYGLAVVGAYSPAGTPGFILLATRADTGKGDYGSSEELQDRSCAIVHQSMP